MERLSAMIGDIGDSRVGGGDSFSDRLSCRYTVTICVLAAFFVTARHYVGEPIGCWCPAHFTDSHVDYTNKVCWVTNNYYLPFSSRIPREGKPRRVIGYYQWVGVMLMCQAVIFYLPRPIWRVLNTRSGMSVTMLTDASIECQRKTEPEARSKIMKYMVNQMTRFLREMTRLRAHQTCSPCCLCSCHGNYLCCMYIVVKLLYIANVVAQIFFLNAFLGTTYHHYGYGVLKNVLQGNSWTESHMFPRVTLCDFKIRVLGHVNRYTVQCALPVNLFNEKIYALIWFWLALVAICSMISMLYWCCKLVYLPHLSTFVRTKLVAMDRLNYASDEFILNFMQNYLYRDGVLIVWLVAENSSDLIAAELLCGIFERYCKEVKYITTPDGSPANNRLHRLSITADSIRRRPSSARNSFRHCDDEPKDEEILLPTDAANKPQATAAV